MSAFVKASGLKSQVADELAHELMPRNQDNETREQPFYRLPGTPHTDEILKKYIETTGRQHAARILQTTEANVTLEQSYQIVYANLKHPITQTPKDTVADKAVIILALGKLSSDNGLPGFAGTTASLESGELLGTLLDRAQTFKGYGGGCGHVSIWSRK